jgi:hypothetical protein
MIMGLGMEVSVYVIIFTITMVGEGDTREVRDKNIQKGERMEERTILFPSWMLLSLASPMDPSPTDFIIIILTHKDTCMPNPIIILPKNPLS